MTEPVQETGEDPNSYFLRKSRYWVERCDIGFMIFIAKADNMGVARELAHLTGPSKDRMWRHMVLLDRHARISTLIKGDLVDWEGQLDSTSFSSQKQLNELAAGRLPDLLRLLYDDIRGRPT